MSFTTPTKAGIELIKQFEGYRNAAYPDPIQGWLKPTVGYGTTVYSNGRRVAKGDTLTVLQATAELEHFVSQRISPALSLLPHYNEMTEPQVSALESFAYNLGPSFYGTQGFETITRVLKEKDWANMRKALMLYVNPGTDASEGLKRRRDAEADLWESGLKTQQPPSPKAVAGETGTVTGTTTGGIPVAPSQPPKPPAGNGTPTPPAPLKPGYLSPNFTFNELIISETATRKGLNNMPGPNEKANLERLCKTILQPLRDKLGQPVVVTSGYRGPQVNAAVGGSTTSAHMYGRAADIHVPGMTNQALMKFIHDMGLPVDQVIEEFGSWVHVGIADSSKAPRGEYLLARTQGGQTIYLPTKP